MVWVLSALLLVAVGIILKPVFKQINFGKRLTKMTSIIEEIEAQAALVAVQQGTKFDELPPYQAAYAKVMIRREIGALQRIPRHVVTRELLKNALLVERMGLYTRLSAINRLLDILIDEGVAMPMDEFRRSYL